MDYPSYPPVIPNAFFAYPWYGYAGNSMCYGSGLQQATQQANIQQLNSRILELQMQQCCCNQITALNNRLSDMVNAAQFQRVLEPKRPKDFRHTISEWAKITGIKKSTIRERLKRGWSDEDALTVLVRKRTKGYRPSTPCNTRMDKEDEQ